LTTPSTGSVGDLGISPGFIADSGGFLASTGFCSAGLLAEGLVSGQAWP
jgi:hypothetical protein